MKAQAGFEFYFAIIAFIAVVVYFFFQLVEYYPSYLYQMKYEILKSEAWQLSEMLINDPGEPINWKTSGTIKRLGLNDETKNQTNLISYEKAAAFNVLCNLDYKKTLELLGTNYTLSVYLVDNAGNVIISCSHPSTGLFTINITRIVAIHSRGISFNFLGKQITLIPEKTWWGELTLELS